MPISIAEAIQQGEQQMRQAGVPDPRREAASIVAHALGRDRSFIITHAEELIDEEHEEIVCDCLQRRAAGEPLQYLTGRQEFFGLDFEVTKDVLIPRPETELLVETAIKLLGSIDTPRFCDVGTGSGCVAIAVLHEVFQARAAAIDLSPRALAVAKRNAAHHGCSDRVDFLAADCFDALSSHQPLFDAILSNPPYVKDDALDGLQREVRDFEPRLALSGGTDGLNVIRRLLSDGARLLKTNGHLLFEIGFDQGAAVEDLIDARVWRLLDIYQDLQRIPRTVALQKRP